MKSSKWLSLSLLTLCECMGTETGNPAHEQDLHVAFAPLSETASRQGLGDVIFDNAMIEVDSLSLEPCSGVQPTVVLDDREVDIFGGDVSAGQLAPGRYCAVIVRIGNDSDSFAASRSVSGGETHLSFASELHADVRLELVEPLNTVGAPPSWILGIDLAEWLDPIGAWLDGDGSPLQLNGPETMALREAQARSLRLYEDVNGDAQLDATDLAVPLSEAGVLLP